MLAFAPSLTLNYCYTMKSQVVFFLIYRACFGTTKYCHAWIRNMVNSFFFCGYLVGVSFCIALAVNLINAIAAPALQRSRLFVFA